MRGPFVTLPNALTTARGLAAIPVAYAILTGRFWLAIAIVVAAGLSDGVDGGLARRLGQTSDVGRILDPLADKLLLVTAFVAASAPNRGYVPLPAWLVGMAILRDVGIVVVAYAVYKATGFTGFRPSFLGKLNTVLELVVVGIFLLTRATGMPDALLVVAVYLTAGSLVASGLHYFVHLRRCLADRAAGAGVRTA